MSKSNPYYHYDVFISYKSEDYEKSKMIYDFLTSEGLKVFLSKESLPRLAVSQYRKEIDSAMDRSHHMLIVCSDIKYLSTKWVEHEINWFSGEKLEGRKSDSNIILLISKEMFETEVLKNNKIFFPECLRQEQIYSLGDGDYKKDIFQYFRCDDNLEESIPQKSKNTNDNFVNKTGRKRVVIATLLLVSAITLILLGLCVSKAIESFNSPDKGNPGGMGDNTPGVYDDTKTHILFGTYPQSRVTDSALVDELNSKEINWISYKYYSGNSNFDGSMAACDIAFYADIKYKGEKYRAVRFDEYRPVLTSERRMSESEGKNTDQFRNGYKINEVYWFKYEPISWCVLDEKEGLVVSDFIIDAQPYVNVLYEGKDGKFYNRTGDYSSCWESSFLREWLNTELLENTFTSSEKKSLKMSQIIMMIRVAKKQLIKSIFYQRMIGQIRLTDLWETQIHMTN